MDKIKDIPPNEKKNNIYLKFTFTDTDNTIKIIINIDKLKKKVYDDDDYIIYFKNKINNMLEPLAFNDFEAESNNCKKLFEYLSRKILEDCLKIKIYNKTNKQIFKNKAWTYQTIYVYSENKKWQLINLKKLKENDFKLYKKFINRYYYYTDEITYIFSKYWFFWFVKNKKEYLIDNPKLYTELDHTIPTIFGIGSYKYFNDYDEKEPKYIDFIDYELVEPYLKDL
jgi:hypothetical protein